MRNLPPAIRERNTLSRGLVGERKANPSLAVASEIRCKNVDAGHCSRSSIRAGDSISLTDRPIVPLLPGDLEVHPHACRDGQNPWWELLSYNYVLSSGRGAMYCNYCGKLIQDDAAVCAYCGVRVGASLARTKLVRPRLGRKVAGVCLGFAEYFDIDVTVVRLVWLVTAIMTGVGFIPYFIAWIVMPEEPLLLPAPASTQQVPNP